MTEAGGRHTDDFIAEVRARTSIVDVVGAHVKLNRKGREHWGCCPFHAERTPSFKANDQRQRFHCFGCGADGDVFKFISKLTGLSFAEAVDELAARAGMTNGGAIARHPEARPVDRPRDIPARSTTAAKDSSLAWCLEVWAEARPAPGTPVETYWRSRGLTIPIPEDIRFVPKLSHKESRLWLPAMVALVRGPDGRPTGIHRTYLAPGGNGKARVEPNKMMAGTVFTGALRFDPAAATMGLGEGIETMASVKQAIPDLACWAALSLNNIAGGGLGEGAPHPSRFGVRLPSVRPDPARPGVVLPPCVRELLIFEDGDNKDPASADALYQRATRRYAGRNIRVRRVKPPAGMDFNDVLRGIRPRETAMEEA